MSHDKVKLLVLITRAREFVAVPNVHFHYRDGAEVMAALADALEVALSEEPEDWPSRERALRAEGAEAGAVAIEEIGKMLIEAAAELRSDKPFATPNHGARGDGVRVREAAELLRPYAESYREKGIGLGAYEACAEAFDILNALEAAIPPLRPSDDT